LYLRLYNEVLGVRGVGVHTAVPVGAALHVLLQDGRQHGQDGFDVADTTAGAARSLWPAL